METSKDLILRSIKHFSEFLIALTKQKLLEMEEIAAYIDEVTKKHFGMTLETIIEKQSRDIIEIINGNDDNENIKDFSDILFIKYSAEKKLIEKTTTSK